jgi:hypothetical protein
MTTPLPNLVLAAILLALAACGGASARPQREVVEAAPTSVAPAAAEEETDGNDLLLRLAGDERCRCQFELSNLAAPPRLRHGALVLRLNPSTIVDLTFPSSGASALRVTAAMLVVVFDDAAGGPKVRNLRLIGAPAAIRDLAGQMMVISPRIALAIGDEGILSVDIDPRGTIKRIPGV